MRTLEITIHPDHLLYRVVCAYPGTETLTELDKLVLAALLVYMDEAGRAILLPDQRRRVMEGLNLTQQGLSNTIRKLMKARMISPHDKGYLIVPDLWPLVKVPKRLSAPFTLKFIRDGKQADTGTV